jgi:predicted ATPase
MLKRIVAKNLSAFASVDLHFASGLNVIVGENGCGMSHLLKVAYAVIASAQAHLPLVSPLYRLLWYARYFVSFEGQGYF